MGHTGEHGHRHARRNDRTATRNAERNNANLTQRNNDSAQRRRSGKLCQRRQSNEWGTAAESTMRRVSNLPTLGVLQNAPAQRGAERIVSGTLTSGREQASAIAPDARERHRPHHHRDGHSLSEHPPGVPPTRAAPAPRQRRPHPRRVGGYPLPRLHAISSYQLGFSL